MRLTGATRTMTGATRAVFAGPNGTVNAIRGAFRTNTATVPPYSARDFTDGLSGTMMISETIAALTNGSFVDVRGDIWSDLARRHPIHGIHAAQFKDPRPVGRE